MARPTRGLQLLSAGIALAPPIAIGLIILTIYVSDVLDRPRDPKHFLMDEIIRGLVPESPLLHPGILGVVVLAGSVLLAEVPIAVARWARSHQALKLAAITAPLALFWIAYTVAQAQSSRDLDPELSIHRAVSPRAEWQVAAETWLLHIGPAVLWVLLPIGIGGGWLIHSARRSVARSVRL